MLVALGPAQRGKYGVVRVHNADGSFNREYKIDAAQLAALHAAKNAPPAGCTPSEWGRQFGIVTVLDALGNLARQFVLRHAQIQALPRDQTGHYILPVAPNERAELVVQPGAVCFGKDFEVGDCEARNGHLTIKYAESVQGGRFVESMLVLKPGEWSGVPPLVSAVQSAIDALPGQPIGSIANGIMDVR